MPSDWTDAKKEAEERMTKRRGDQAVRDHTAGKERAMARRSKPGRPRGFGPDAAEGKAIREGVIKKMGRVFRPKKAQEADAAEARDAAFAEAMEAVEASPPVEEAVAGEAEAPAEPSMTPTAKLRDPIKTLDDGSIEYQPKGDPWQYRKSPEGVYTVIDPETGEAVMTSSPGDDSYANFEAHFKGQETEFTRGPYSDEEIDAVNFVPADQVPPSDEEIDAINFVPADQVPPSKAEIDAIKFKPADEVLASDEIDDIEFAPPPKPPVAYRGGELTEEAVTTGPHRLVSPDGTVINKRVAAQIARGELDPDAWDKLHEELKGSGRIKWSMGPSVEDLLADEGFVRTAGGTPTRVAARKALAAHE